ncbi:glutathionylspermidine synthase family protein [Rossellomorea vietnamensis]|uniref:Glutathionylspermidine synthase family protein n=1 Tax=Rossellomorea vietnamensis TaxID=218284 RepID=A0A6I6UWX7_9BACI|nr:glutathionylspermidine synthase family protein [Rossellomorea vietnamensis]QHE63576.1 glutathionylspermidine synthase family protein [Rossellomorea vietnamensis]
MPISHQAKRRGFYNGIPEFWHDLYDMEYSLLDIHLIPRNTIMAIQEASKRVYAIFDKTADLLRELDDGTLLELGYPEESLSYIKCKSVPQECIIGRFDFVVSNGDMKLLEFNSDTPTFIKELYHVNEKVCEYFDYANPNEGMEEQLSKELKRALLSSWKSLQREGDAKIVFTSHADHEEDYLTTKYIQDLSGVPSEYVSLDQLQIRNDGLFTPDGERIDVLYRQTYPIEHLVEDEDPLTNDKVGQELMQLVLDKKLAVLNPPSAFLLQSKGVQALIWGLHEEGSTFFTKEEHQWIERYFLPTYLDPETFEECGMTYVQKPVFGREGDTVKILEATGKVLLEDKNETYKQTLPVYQQFCPLPVSVITTDEGEKEASLMVGSFIINGNPGAIGIRAGNAITDNESYFLPVGIQER